MLALLFESIMTVYVAMFCILLALIAFLRWLYYGTPKNRNRKIHIPASSSTSYSTSRQHGLATSTTYANTTHRPAREETGAEISKYSLKLCLVSLGVALFFLVGGQVYGGRDVLADITTTVQDLYVSLIGL